MADQTGDDAPLKGLSLNQFMLLARLGREAEANQDQALPNLGDPLIDLDRNDRNALDRFAKALGHSLGAHGPSDGPSLIAKSGSRWRLTDQGVAVARRARLVEQSVRWTCDGAGFVPRAAGVPFTCYPSHLVRYQSTLFPARDVIAPAVPIEVGASHREDGGARIAALLDSGRVHLAIGPKGLDVPERIGSALLYTSKIRAIVDRHSRVGRAAHSRKANRKLSIQVVAEFELAVSPKGHRSRKQLEAAFDQAGLRLDPIAELADPSALRALSDGNLRLALIPDDAFEGPPPNHWPEVTDEAGSALTDEHWLYWDQGPDMSEPIRIRIDELVAELSGAQVSAT